MDMDQVEVQLEGEKLNISTGATAVAVEESASAAGQLLVLGDDGGLGEHSVVYLLDVATGHCVRQLDLLHSRVESAAARLPDGHIVCAGGFDGAADRMSAEVWVPPEPPAQGAVGAAWTRRELPNMSVARYGCCGCVMSDGRFAVLGGCDPLDYDGISSCEALAIGVGEHWRSLPAMHDSRVHAACIIVTGGHRRKSSEVYCEELNLWFRLLFDLPCVGDGTRYMGMGSFLW